MIKFFAEMSTKLQAKLLIVSASIFEFISWFAVIPPEQQSGLLGQIVEVVPEHWKANVGLCAKFIARSLAIYAVVKASHSGPQTPPQNPPV